MSELEALLAALREQGQREDSPIMWTRDAARDDWRDKLGHRGPIMNIHVGSAGGVLICGTQNGDAYHTARGFNDEPVNVYFDRYAAGVFPPGAVIPVERMVDAVREFHRNPGLPTSVDWVRWDDNSQVIYFDDNGNETGRLFDEPIS